MPDLWNISKWLGVAAILSWTGMVSAEAAGYTKFAHAFLVAFAIAGFSAGFCALVGALVRTAQWANNRRR